MHRSRLTAAALLLAVILAGCTDDPVPKRADPTPDAPSDTPSSISPSSPTTSPLPERESIEEFLQRWQATGDEMQQTGMVAEYAALSLGCDSCDSFVETVEGIYADGGSIQFDGSTIVRTAKVARAGNAATYDLTIKSSVTRFRKSDGSPLNTLPSTRERIRVTLVERRSWWFVTSFSRLATT